MIKKEPHRVPDWVTWVVCVLAAVGIVTQQPPVVIVAGVLAIWWLVQHVRWTNWDVARRTEAMKAEIRGSRAEWDPGHDDH